MWETRRGETTKEKNQWGARKESEANVLGVRDNAKLEESGGFVFIK